MFVAVAEAGSLSAAARHLRMPLTTVSRQLAALEEQVGVRLMTRTTRISRSPSQAVTISNPAVASSPSLKRWSSPLPGSTASRGERSRSPHRRCSEFSMSSPSWSRFSMPSRASPTGCSSSIGSSI
ncbi:MAG: LysR family transcriptional regulator [Methyloceanibacter sp.]